MSQANVDPSIPNISTNEHGSSSTFPIFFYGSLMDPDMLKFLLDLKGPQAMVPAVISHYAIKLWGPYPALVPRAGSKVRGAVWRCTPAQFARLEYYEGNTYTWTECEVEVDNNENIDGEEKRLITGCRVFVAKDPDSDDLEEGEWSLDEFKSVLENLG